MAMEVYTVVAEVGRHALWPYTLYARPARWAGCTARCSRPWPYVRDDAQLRGSYHPV